MSTSRPTFTARTDTIPDWIIEVLHLVDQVAASQGISYVIVGAKARELVQESVFGLAPCGLSEDLDFGLAVKDWREFSEFKAALIATGRFEPSKREIQRVLYRDAEGLRRLVDLIPFGGVADENGTIAWPPSQDIVMTVAGFEDAMSSAILVRVADDLIVPLASLAGLTLLKLIAWTDRGAGNNKDAIDLYRLLTNYADAGNADRLYREEIHLLEEVDYDFELAGARLLGRDVASILSSDTATRIINFFQSDKEVERLLLQMLQEPRILDEQDQARCAELLRAFRSSLFSHAAKRTEHKEEL